MNDGRATILKDQDPFAARIQGVPGQFHRPSLVVHQNARLTHAASDGIAHDQCAGVYILQPDVMVRTTIPVPAQHVVEYSETTRTGRWVLAKVDATDTVAVDLVPGDFTASLTKLNAVLKAVDNVVSDLDANHRLKDC